MIDHIKWPDIESFHNIRKYTKAYPELLNGNSKVEYKSKIKLHGSNAAIRIFSTGEVVVQSRTTIITPTSDNVGFAKWVENNQKIWSELRFNFTNKPNDSVIIFGEFCGKGIQAGAAITKLQNRIFAVFAVQILPGDELIVEPKEIAELLPTIHDVYVIPWEEQSVFVDWSESAEELQKPVQTINEMVEIVEKCDPFVKTNFGIEGIGEGLVFYPVSHPGIKSFGELCFKAKGEAHKVVKMEKSAQVNPASAANATAFANLVLTEARLEQGARSLNENAELLFDMKNVGKFIGWINKDVVKECAAELEASGLTWDKQVQKQVGDLARTWFMDKTKKDTF